MKVTDQDVQYVAELAHLELTAAESERMVRDLNNILGYVDRLNQLDTSGVPPLAHTLIAPAGGAPGENAASPTFDTAMREDELGPCVTHEEALANAPTNDGTYFMVPKVIER